MRLSLQAGLLAGSLISSIITLVSAAPAHNWTQVTNFASKYDNPTNVSFYIYVPDVLQKPAPILVVPHWCHGAAADVFRWSGYAAAADQYGFIVIYPDSPNTADKCWDVSSKQTLTHNGGGDSKGIVSMVKWTLKKYKADANRVFSVGTSSGAMMTNVLLGSYPDVFAAGSAWAGVAFGCFAADGYDVWNSECANGNIIKTGKEWAAIVKAAYPGYHGFRPKMHVLHGSLDNILYPQNFQEEIKEWTAVLGLPSKPVKTWVGWPQANWTTYVYGDSFRATKAEGIDHNIPVNETVVLDWFDLKCKSGGKKPCFSRKSGY